MFARCEVSGHRRCPKDKTEVWEVTPAWGPWPRCLSVASL
jgi:hypothetical protein